MIKKRNKIYNKPDNRYAITATVGHNLGGNTTNK